LKTQQEVRQAFWEQFGDLFPDAKRSKRQNDQPTDVRVSFVDFVDYLQQSGEISEKLAEKVTL
jgi:hypothetical protein